MARIPRAKPETPGQVRDRAALMAEVAGEIDGWRPAVEVLRNVRAIRTCFLDYDRVTGVGGHPIDRITVLHGPSNEGKTEFLLGLGRSFLEAGHFFGMADAERTTPHSWAKQLMGSWADSSGFRALPVGTYEQVRGAVRDLFHKVADSRSRLGDDTTCLVGVDSLRKLVPELLWKEMQKAVAEELEEKKKGGRRPKKSKMGSRIQQIKAQLNAAWMDELVPLVADTGCAIVIIAREYQGESTGFFDDDPVVVGGGRAVNFDASLRLRIVRSFIWDEVQRINLAERHAIEVHKTKVSGKTERVPMAFFHTKLGNPPSWDFARDSFLVGRELGAVEEKGSFYSFSGKRLAQGVENAIRYLDENPVVLEALRVETRARIDAARQVAA